MTDDEKRSLREEFAKDQPGRVTVPLPDDTITRLPYVQWLEDELLRARLELSLAEHDAAHSDEIP